MDRSSLIMEHEESLSSPSLKQKLKLSLTPSCFPVHQKHHHHHHHHHHHQSDASETPAGTPDAKTRLIRMSSNPWLKNRSHHHHSPDIPELKDKCRHLISRIGGGSSKHSRRHSIDLNYDASSYALNFDDDDKNLGEEPLKSFSSRLPPSPNREINAV